MSALFGSVREARADEVSPASTGSSSASSDAQAPVTPRIELRHRFWLDLGIAAGLGAGIVVWRVVRPDVVTTTCRFCDGSAAGKVNGVDDAFRSAFKRRDITPAVDLGDAVSLVAAPVGAVGLTVAAAASDRRTDEALTDVVLVAEATLTAVATSEALRAITARERPEVHAASGDAKTAALADVDALSSFPDGHTTLAFALAASAGTIATMRGYRIAPLVWIAGGMLGLASGYLHMAADRSYFTDAIAGAVLGSGVGVGVPLLFHRPAGGAVPAVASAAVPGGRVVSARWAF